MDSPISLIEIFDDVNVDMVETIGWMEQADTLGRYRVRYLDFVNTCWYMSYDYLLLLTWASYVTNKYMSVTVNYGTYSKRSVDEANLDKRDFTSLYVLACT